MAKIHDQITLHLYSNLVKFKNSMLMSNAFSRSNALSTGYLLDHLMMPHPSPYWVGWGFNIDRYIKFKAKANQVSLTFHLKKHKNLKVLSNVNLSKSFYKCNLLST